MEEIRLLWQIPDGEKIVSTVMFYGVLIIATENRLYAYGEKGTMQLLKFAH